MNRRSFIKTILATLIATQIPIDMSFERKLNFEQWIKVNGELWINNPRACAIITDIAME